MFLTQEQNKALEVPFGYGFRTMPRVVAAQFQACTYVSPASTVKAKRRNTNALELRQVLDLALDRTLLMSELGAARFAQALNLRLPPVWPGESPIQLQLACTGSTHCFAVTVPTEFHNRLHRFPFDDGFLVCPVPDCTGTPRLQGVLYRHEGAKGEISCILEHTCHAGHHWQSIFSDDNQVTPISVVRLKRAIRPNAA